MNSYLRLYLQCAGDSKLLPYLKSRLNSKSRPLNASDAAATKVLRHLKANTTEKITTEQDRTMQVMEELQLCTW